VSSVYRQHISCVECVPSAHKLCQVCTISTTQQTRMVYRCLSTMLSTYGIQILEHHATDAYGIQALVLQMCCSVWYTDTGVADVFQRMVYRHLCCRRVAAYGIQTLVLQMCCSVCYTDTGGIQILMQNTADTYQTTDTSTRGCVLTHVHIRVYRHTYTLGYIDTRTH
jgi:hypothetical protein